MKEELKAKMIEILNNYHWALEGELGDDELEKIFGKKEEDKYCFECYSGKFADQILSLFAEEKKKWVEEIIESFRGIQNMDRKMLSLKEIIEILEELKSKLN